MSEVAAKVGINRPALHYYFRTKDKMFKAVFGMIIQSIVPKVQDILLRKDEPISQRIGNVVDTYYAVFREKCLPAAVRIEGDAPGCGLSAGHDSVFAHEGCFQAD